MGFRFLGPKHQAKVKLLLVVIIRVLEVPVGARYGANFSAINTHTTQRCIKMLPIQIPELGDITVLFWQSLDSKPTGF